MDPALLDALRFRSEGTDLDFKQAQYRFVQAEEKDKAELLKDIMAMANAWREGPGYILLGVKDARPHPAEVIGINEQLDDAKLQQFVGSKVRPKLTFRYEEGLYEGKTVGVISIPKQTRPFYLQHPYGPLKSNVVYVRRGSSTDEAEPPEIAKMVAADAGKGDAVVDLLVTRPGNAQLEATFERRFITFDRMPDYELPGSHDDPFRLASISLHRANHRYWRELVKFVAVRASAVELCIVLRNRSTFSLSGTKVEVFAEPLDAQSVFLALGKMLPSAPANQYSTFDIGFHRPDLAHLVQAREPAMTLRDSEGHSVCGIRLGTLLPGESARAPDTVVVRAAGPGRIHVKCRILAGELAMPIEQTVELRLDGQSQHIQDEYQLRAAVQDPFLAALVSPKK